MIPRLVPEISPLDAFCDVVVLVVVVAGVVGIGDSRSWIQYKLCEGYIMFYTFHIEQPCGGDGKGKEPIIQGRGFAPNSLLSSHTDTLPPWPGLAWLNSCPWCYHILWPYSCHGPVKIFDQ